MSSVSYPQYAARLEDFWGRRQAKTAETRAYTIFGLPLTVQTEASEHRDALYKSIELALSAYTQCPPLDNVVAEHAMSLQMLIQPSDKPLGPPPRDLYASNDFIGRDDWLMVQIGAWGYAHVDLTKRHAVIVLAPELAQEPDVVARGVLHTVLTNLLFTNGFSMLHCTGLVRDGRLLLLMAPHNSGKSTTALRLAISGYQLLSDSQIYVSSHHKSLTLLGFPVGRARLRKDMLPSFPQLHEFLYTELVRGETKFSFDLREFDRSMVHEQAVTVDHVDLCLLQRGDGRAETQITAVSAETIWNAVVENSVFYDSAEVWDENLRIIKPLVERANHWQLTIGTDADGIIEAVNAAFG